MSTMPFIQTHFSRRAVVGSGIAGAALSQLAPFGPTVASTTAAVPLRQEQDATAELANWKMWFLDAPDALRPPAPGSPAPAEIDEVIGYLEAPSEAMTAAIAAWGARTATTPWTAAAIAAFSEFRVPGMRQSRNYALLHTAMHDAAVAAWDAQLAYERPSPAATDDRIVPTSGANPESPTYPSEHAAVAGAAAAVLANLLPDAAPGRFDDLAEEAAMSRVWAGAAFPSDVEAGLALGKEIGELAVAHGESDGSDATFDLATMSTGPGIWQPTPPAFADPYEPLAGTWKTWLLETGDQIRPGAPPDFDTPLWHSEYDAAQEIVRTRTLAERADAVWWNSAASGNFYGWAEELIAQHGLDTPHAARVMAYMATSIADAIIAVWDAKYTWWSPRPITIFPDLVTAFPTPPYPDYPSGYSAVAGAMSQSVGFFFPSAAQQLDELAWRAARSRAWAGIHIPLANEVGLCMGRRVARLATLRAMEEGAISA